MMNTKETKQGYATFGYTDGKTHYLTWTVKLGEPTTKSMRKRHKGHHRGSIHYLSLDVDGETEVLFDNGWEKRPPMLGCFGISNVVKTYTQLLADLYN